MEKTSCFYRYSGDCTWYQPQACKFLKLEHHIHLPYEKKSLIDRIFSMLMIESKALIMTIFHVEEKSVNYNNILLTIGSTFWLIIIIRRREWLK
jgi:hypothetical protein